MRKSVAGGFSAVFIATSARGCFLWQRGHNRTLQVRFPLPLLSPPWAANLPRLPPSAKLTSRFAKGMSTETLRNGFRRRAIRAGL